LKIEHLKIENYDEVVLGMYLIRRKKHV